MVLFIEQLTITYEVRVVGSVINLISNVSQKKILKENDIEYAAQYRNFELFGYKSLDFYLPKLNIAIECQGEQYFKSIERFGGKRH